MIDLGESGQGELIGSVIFGVLLCTRSKNSSVMLMISRHLFVSWFLLEHSLACPPRITQQYGPLPESMKLTSSSVHPTRYMPGSRQRLPTDAVDLL